MTLTDFALSPSVSEAPSVTTGPITGSTKLYRGLDGHDGARVPFRRVNLSNGEHLDLYDTSGPYTDEHTVIELTQVYLPLST